MRQLAAISRATLNDDVFGEDQTTTQFERHMAAVCGQEAAAFVMSGTMANQLSIAALCQHRPHAVLADASAHVVNFEAGGLALLSGATVQPVQPSNKLYLTVADIPRHANVPPATTTTNITTPTPWTAPPPRWEVCPTTIISLENTAHGNIIPLPELRAIREWTSHHNIRVHIDGARVWDAVAAGAGTLAEIAGCADAMTLSFAKGIGAPVGAMVVGSAEVMGRVKRLRQSVGGGVRKVGVLAAAAREAVLESFGPGGVDSVRGAFGAGHGMAEVVARMWTDRGGRLVRPTETNMVWLDLVSAGVTAEVVNEMGVRSGILVAAPRIVLHHQICAKALASLEQVFEDILVRRQQEAVVTPSDFGVQSKGCGQVVW